MLPASYARVASPRFLKRTERTFANVHFSYHGKVTSQQASNVRLTRWQRRANSTPRASGATSASPSDEGSRSQQESAPRVSPSCSHSSRPPPRPGARHQPRSPARLNPTCRRLITISRASRNLPSTFRPRRPKADSEDHRSRSPAAPDRQKQTRDAVRNYSVSSV